MPWLISEDRVLASLEVAANRRARASGLLGRDGIDGALWLTRTRSIHTFGMRFSIDAAYCDTTGEVIALTTMKPWRLGLPRLRARSVIETEAGMLALWGVKVGARLEIAEAPPA